MYGFSNYIWFFLPGLLLGLYARFKLTSAYARYSREPVSSGISGAEAARELLDHEGLHNVPVEEIPGHLTDHYDPSKKALFLSSENFHGRSIAAVGVAAHEAGHALQHKAAYAPLQLRMAMVPVMGFASNAAMWIFFLGMFMHLTTWALLAIIVFAIITFFQVVTLPVEWDASRRAKEKLFALGFVRQDERPGVSRVLDAAGLTYVAGMVSSLLQLLYFISIFQGARERERS
jgi:Zn-dependent membrane protease YugP